MRRVLPLPFPTESLVTSAKDLGQAIRAARTGSGLTIEDAALLVGVAKQTLSDVEQGKPTVAFGTVIKLATALGVSLFMAEKKNQERVRRGLTELVDET
ncbi:helix-turn-helix domain-containing protein [Niveibacterium terrae]|uniref:helix-turn-helix domain-containing protein n=1 Tax=Niveibacterium terrae TaxID=3373598 RepID=UPI003A955CAF